MFEIFIKSVKMIFTTANPFIMFSAIFRRPLLTCSFLVALFVIVTYQPYHIGTPVSKTPNDAIAHNFSNSSKAPTFSVRTTAYTHTESDHITYGAATAAGTKLRTGVKYNSAAADWSRFPLGTVFRIKGEPTVYVIDDYGSALVGTSTIDIYRPTIASMNKWGVRNVEIEILKTGDVKKSRKILSSRTSWSHCRAMHSDMTRG